jgi:hypothetical protein
MVYVGDSLGRTWRSAVRRGEPAEKGSAIGPYAPDRALDARATDCADKRFSRPGLGSATVMSPRHIQLPSTHEGIGRRWLRRGNRDQTRTSRTEASEAYVKVQAKVHGA